MYPFSGFRKSRNFLPTYKYRGQVWLFILASLIASSLLGCTNNKASQVIEFSVYNTPGKPLLLFDPSQPAERIAVKRKQDTYIMTITINVPREGITSYFEKEASITEEEWQNLIRLVEEQKISDFKPQEISGEVVDFGVHGFVIVDENGTNRKEWTRPIKNFDALESVGKYLIELVSEKFPAVKLYYLP